MLKSIFRNIYRWLNRLLSVRSNVVIHPNLVVGVSSYITAPNRLEIGRDVSIGRNCWIACDGRIGNGVLISSYVAIAGRYDHDMREVGVPISMASWVYDSDLSEDVKDKNTIVIEDDVWIGVGSVILSGLRVGRSAVIAAGSTVTRDVSENTIVAGNPAKAVGQRFSASDFVIQSEALSRRYRK